ncbi:unnamed protein product [Adineta ricciae]|uniref:LRAT domain-containing protein n=1 Tax=Adineta ricciae TaxID=249248 RepID=A0A813WFQ1_ADIRI|nr:unnamed protein product [Adineta ricciae]CAF1430792.1 unnamed protein product [Adineta ricciae]
MSDHNPQRGDHLYAWRKIRLYQHHGIVVTKEDLEKYLPSKLMPKKVDPLMVIEQNLQGLRIVTLGEFRLEHPFNYEHRIGCARYGIDVMEYYVNRRGTCYLTKRLSEDQVVKNAIRIYSDEKQRDMWKTYSLVLKNCEQFAFMCSTNLEHVLGEQVLMGCNIVRSIFVNGMYSAVECIFHIVELLAKQMIRGVPINIIIKENALAALTASVLETLLLSVRLFVYYYYKEKRTENLARKYAITPHDYIQQMIQAGLGNLSAFGLSIAGMVVKSSVFVSAMSPTAFSIFFGFIGYLAARWITGLIALKIRRIKASNILNGNPTFSKEPFRTLVDNRLLKVESAEQLYKFALEGQKLMKSRYTIMLHEFQRDHHIDRVNTCQHSNILFHKQLSEP